MIKVGSDAELFLMKDGMIVSAHGKLKGTKEKPQKTKHGYVQIDGMAVEVNVKPATSTASFIENTLNVLQDARNLLKGFTLISKPVVNFTEEYMSTIPPESRQLGCEPDFDAWNEAHVNPEPDASSLYRTGSGHIHIGWGKFHAFTYDHVADCCSLGMQLDYSLGLPSLLFDNCQMRRKLYGGAGAFRPKEYGIEYRVLSNAWINNPRLMKWVFDNAMNGYHRWRSGNTNVYYPERSKIRNMISGVFKKKDVISICEYNNIVLPPEDLWSEL